MGGGRKQREYPVSEPISVILKDGRVIHGTLCLEASRRGSFQVFYSGVTKSDHRTDYTSTEHIRSVAKILLQELAEEVR